MPWLYSMSTTARTLAPMGRKTLHIPAFSPFARHWSTLTVIMTQRIVESERSKASFVPSSSITKTTTTMSSLDPLTAVVDALKREEIIPDVISTDFTPSVLFSIVYDNGKEALLSSEMAVDDTQEEPEINFTPLTFSKDSLSSVEEPTYTLVLTDPDARSRAAPIFREFRHWVITGLKAPAESSQSATNLTATKTKPSTTPYRGPGPPPGTGLHRYCFLLFQEPTGGYTIPEGSPEYGSALEDRRSWSAVKFGEKYGLKLVGANYFQCQNPDQTPQS